jgi:hypothetical protein
VTGRRGCWCRRSSIGYHGLLPAGPEALDHINDLIHDEPDQVVDGSVFAHRVQYWFHRISADFRGRPLEIGEATGGAELLIADSPVLALRRGGVNGVGDLRAPSREAGTVSMRIGPRHLIALDRQQHVVPLDSDTVDRFNQFQVGAARRWVAFHPSAPLQAFVRGQRPPGRAHDAAS